MRAEFLRFQSCLFALLLIFARAASTQAQNEKESQALKEADAAFHAGVAARDAGKLDEAQARFAAVVRLAPKIPEGHAALGEVLIELGRPAEAAPEFEAALHLRPGDQGFEANLALADAAAGKAAKAVTEFAAALDQSKNPGGQVLDAAFYQAYARSLAATGKPTEAVVEFQKAIELGAATPGLFDAVGSLYAQSGDWD